MHNYASNMVAHNGEYKYNLFANNCGMVQQQILHEAGLDYGLISGSAMDEKIALIALFSTPVIKGFGAGWFVGEIYNDFHDMTRPNDIFIAGLRLAKDKGWSYYD